MEQFYRIADLTVAMDTFGRTLELAQPYVTEPVDRADIYIQSDTENVARKNPGMNSSHIEYLASGASFYHQLLHHGGMLLHSSAVVVDGKAYLFTAPRKTGKSTHVQLWLQVFGDRAQILNDDKPALRMVDGVWYAYGTPWSGKAGKNTNLRVPVAGIAVVERGEQNSIVPYTGPAAIRFMMEQTVRPNDPRLMMGLLQQLDSLLTTVPVWKLTCNMDPEAALVAYRAMSGNEEENQ